MMWMHKVCTRSNILVPYEYTKIIKVTPKECNTEWKLTKKERQSWFLEAPLVHKRTASLKIVCKHLTFYFEKHKNEMATFKTKGSSILFSCAQLNIIKIMVKCEILNVVAFLIFHNKRLLWCMLCSVILFGVVEF